MPEPSGLIRAAGTVGAATLLSRILGYARDMLIAWIFGAGMSTDAFVAAFRIPNLLRRLFGEGVLSAGFVPVFSQILLREGREEAYAMARSAFRLWGLVLAAAAALCVLLAPQIMGLIAYGFRQDPQKFALAVSLSRLMAPYLLFIGLVALSMGILNSLGHFAAPALAPAVLNITMIAAALFLTQGMPAGVAPITAVALGVVLGGLLQLGLQVPFLAGRGLWHGKGTPAVHPGVVRAGRLMAPTVFGSAVYQINILVTTLFASLLADGSLSCLYFADRLAQFPLGLFGMTAAIAALPTLCRKAAGEDAAALVATLSQLLRFVMFVTLPAVTGLILLREPIVRLLFQRGAFDPNAARLTADVFLYYGLGLWAVAAARVVVQAFYALQDAQTPVRAGVAAVMANVVFMVVLAGPMGPSGLALAVSLAAALNLALLLRALKKKLGRLDGADMLLSVGRSSLCTVFMGVAVWALVLWTGLADAGGTAELLWGLAAGMTAGAVVYAGAAVLLKSPEMKSLMGWARRR